MRIAINGFGRIGRTFLRVLFSDEAARKKIDVIAINIGPAPLDTVAHMFTYDTLMGTFKGSVALEDKELVVDGHRITLLAECDPDKLDWRAYDIDWVVDASGRFTHRNMAQKHITAGARKVLISAPAHDEDVTIIMGVNEQQYDAQKHTIVSIGSCTTNAVVPMLYMLDKAYGVQGGNMTTIHAYTNSQVLLDVEHKDLRRARAAALNIVPTTTGSAKLIGKVLPQLQNKVTATAIRVPVGKVSLIDLVVTLKNATTPAHINDMIHKAAQGDLSGIVGTTHDKALVSCDFMGDSHSAVIDTLLTQTEENICHLFGWYDNEWGYSARLKDFLCTYS